MRCLTEASHSHHLADESPDLHGFATRPGCNRSTMCDLQCIINFIVVFVDVKGLIHFLCCELC